MRIKNHQRGVSIVAILIVVGILAFLGVKIFPLYKEKSSMVFSLESLAAQPDIAKQSHAKLKSMLRKRLSINDVTYITPTNFDEYVKVEKLTGGFKMTVKYYRATRLAGDFFLLIDSEHSIEVTK